MQTGAYAERRRQQQQQRHVVNGRLATKKVMGLDAKRSLLVAAVCLVLWLTNPAHSQSSFFEDDWITDYGFFSVFEYGDRITFSVASVPVNCWFRGARRMSTDQEPPLDFCSMLRDQLAHQKPLLWDPHDDVHSLHRLFMAVLVITSLLILCRPPYSNIFTGNKWLDPVLSLFVHNPRQPLFGLFWCGLQANVLLYPIWKTIVSVTVLQDSTSWLKLFSADYRFGNHLVTLFSIIVVAAATNAAGHYWTGQYLLRFEGLIGAALGYYRGVLGGKPPGFSLSLLTSLVSFLPESVSVNGVTWSFLIACATQQSPIVAAAFFGANVAGAQVGQYQYRHLGLNAAFQQVAEGLGSFFTKMFGM